MLKSFFYIPLLLFLNFAALGQVLINEQNTGSGKVYALNNDFDYYVTKSSISIDSIIEIDRNGLFASVKSPADLNPGYVDSYYWYRITIENTSDLKKDLTLVVGSNVVSVVELFEVIPGGTRSLGQTGNAIPWDERIENSFAFNYKVDLSPKNQKTYYLMVDARTRTLQLVLLLMDQKWFTYIEKRAYIIYGFFSGALLLSAVFNLFIYFFLKDRVHLLYFFYAISNWLLLLSFRNMDSQFIYPSFSSAGSITRMIYACLSLFFTIGVMQSFLSQKSTNSRFFLLINIFKWLCLLFIPFNLIIEYLPARSVLPFRMYIFSIICFFCVLLILLSCVEKLIQGVRFALFYLVAVLVMIIGAMKVILINLQVINTIEMPPNLLETGIVVETVIIFLGILYRYNLFKKDNDRLKLALQTEQQQSIQQVLAAQEAEQKRIAADLHDELGGNLAAIKMTLQGTSLPSEKLTLLNSMIDHATVSARNISHNLMPPEFQETNLITLFRNHFHRLNAEGSVIIRFYCTGNDSHFDKQDELMIYRIVMELSNNIVRHSNASEATLQLVYNDTQLEIMVEDNGTGFKEDISKGMGLNNVRSRIGYLNGTVVIDSSPNGTTIIIQIPYKQNYE